MAKNLTSIDKLGLYSSIIAAAFLTLWAVFSIITGFTSINILDVIIGVIFLFIGGLTLFYAVRIYRKVLYMDELLDSAFENVIYKRLEPLVNVLSETRVEVQDFSLDMKMLLNKVEDIESELEHVKKISPEIPQPNIYSNFTVQNIFLLVITLAFFIYVIEVPNFITIIPYMIPIMFFSWWFLFTNQFKLFNIEDSWVIGFAPIIVVPIISIFLNSILDLPEIVGILFLLLILYAASYYSWCSYKVNGSLPFSIHHDLREAYIELNKKNK
ncbi:MAG: hypothetical protein E4G94_04950 [ANME-2 cluster archaeon]|nr:MAG: hypothetical protein E4G94_04950 [ANME-2 cluster archaeon]